MTHPLLQAVRRTGRRARLLLLARAVTVCLAGCLGVLLIAGWSDYLLRSTDPAMRLLLTTLVFLAWIRIGWRFLAPPLRLRGDDVAIARWMERSLGDRDDRLSSAIAFLTCGSSEPVAGSRELRQLHIEEAAAIWSMRRGTRFLRWNRLTKPVGALMLLAVIGGGIWWCAPMAAQTALLRILAPWNELNWPRRNQLAFVDAPTRLAAGQDFNAVIVDRNHRLPPNVRLSIWYDGDAASEVQHFSMHFAGGRMVHRLSNVTRSFRYRAEGGDDHSMPWIALEVVEPPELASIQLRVDPPPYTGIAAYESSERVRAIVDSHLRIQGRLTHPVDRVALHVEPAQALERQGAGEGNTAAMLSADRLGFHWDDTDDAGWVIRQSGKVWLELTTEDGVHVESPSWEIQALEDHAPSISAEPLTGGGLLTPHTHLTARATVRDDIAIRRIDMELHKSDSSLEPIRIDVYRGPESCPPRSIDEVLNAPQDMAARYDIDFGALGLSPGDVVELQWSATDYRGQTTTTEPQVLRVVSEDEFQERLVQLQSQLLPTLASAIAAQRESRGHVRTIEAAMEEGVTAGRRESDQLLAAGLAQDRVADLVQGSRQSLASQIAMIRQEMSANGLHNPDLEGRLDFLGRRLTQLTNQVLPSIDGHFLLLHQNFPDAGKSPVVDVPTLRSQLGRTATSQEASLALLEEMAESLRQWEGYRQFAGDLQQIVREQQQILAEGLALQDQVLGKERHQLSPQQRTELRRLSQRQLETERAVDRLLARMSAGASQLRDSDPLASRAVQEAIDVATRRELQSNLREGARDLEQNRVGKAASRQRNALATMEEILDTLAHRPASGAARRAALIREAAEQVDALREQQKALDTARTDLAKRGAAADSTDLKALAEQQQSLSHDAESLAERVERLQTASAQRLRDAGQSMQAASESVQRRNFEQSNRHASDAETALAEAREALEHQLAQQRREAHEQVREWLTRRLESWITEQQRLSENTSQAQQQLVEQSVWSREQKEAVRRLAADQRSLADELQDGVEKLAEFSLLQLQLENVASSMSNAALRLAQFDTSLDAQTAQRDAVAGLRQIQQAFAAAERSPPPSPNAASNADLPPGQQDEASAGITVSIEELELVRILQEELAAETERLEQRKRADPRSGDNSWREEDAHLARQQEHVAAMLARLMAPSHRDNPQP